MLLNDFCVVVVSSHSVMSNSLGPRGLQHHSLSCPLSPGVCSNSCSLNWWCHPTISFSVIPFSSCLQSFPASVFSSKSAFHIRRPKYWSFSFSISPSSEYSGFILFRIDWVDLVDQRALKSLHQHHSSKVSILQPSTFFMVQLWHLYMTTGKTMALTRWTFVSKLMSLLFNMLSRFSSKEQASFNFMAAVHRDFGAQENDVCHYFQFFPIYLPWSDRIESHDLSFLNIEF